MKTKQNTTKYNTVGTFPKNNRKIVERNNIDTVTHKHMTTNFPNLVQPLP